MPPIVSTSRISWVAYATLERASLAKIGRARRLGSRVCPARAELTGLPMIERFRTRVSTLTGAPYGPLLGNAGRTRPKSP